MRRNTGHEGGFFSSVETSMLEPMSESSNQNTELVINQKSCNSNNYNWYKLPVEVVASLCVKIKDRIDRRNLLGLGQL